MRSVGQKILVLDGDCNAACAIVQSLGRAGYEVWLAAPSIDFPAFASRYVARAVTYPDPLADKSAFQRWCVAFQREHRFALIVPPSECTLIPLHEIRDEIDGVALPPPAAVDIAFDKERVRELAVELGIATPESLLLDKLDDPRLDAWLAEGAVVVKAIRSKVWNGATASQPRVGFASSRAGLERLVREMDCSLQVQRWVPGRGVGVEMLVDRGEIVLSFAHERIHELPLTGGGSSYRRAIEVPKALLEAAAKLMRALAWHGVAMVEFRVSGGDHWLMEINGRFWGSLPLACFAGVDFPKALAGLLLQGVRPSVVRPKQGVYARNVSRDVQWTKAILKHDKNDRLLLTKPIGASLLEWTRIFSNKETWDGARLEDPAPIVFELSRTLKRELRSLRHKARRRPAPPKELAGKRRVLVLCHGNICRSAYADARLGKPNGFELRSAGFHPVIDRTSPAGFVAVAHARGVNLAEHRSRLVTRDDLDWAELVVIMDHKNYDALAELDRASLSKTMWLGALDPSGPLEIEDPYGEPAHRADAVLERMDRCLEKLTRALEP
jgi:protein-tyrosine-phosphatase/predicted ATP-grasp superfamily ATP-dependent carboligase